MTGGSARIVRANALALPIADESVDLVVTSPPYFGLRSYQDGGEHYDGQVGAEPTPAEFVDSLIAATREMVRVLKPAGSIWVNLGDKYSSGNSGDRNTGFNIRHGNAAGRLVQERSQTPSGRVVGMQPKSLIGIPWRYAIRCIDDLDLILRAEVIWSKPNGLPESVTDRVRRSHETWFHFTRSPRYFSAVDEIREAVAPANARGKSWKDRSADGEVRGSRYAEHIGTDGAYKGGTMAPNPLGKLPGSVWTIPTQPLKVPEEIGVDHFAAFPMEWPRRIIQGWSPAGVCTACGEGRRPVVYTPSPVGHVRESIRDDIVSGVRGVSPSSGLRLSGGPAQKFRAANPTQHMGYACACPDTTAPTTPAIVLDPFGGTGTTALVAKALDRHGISVDMSADYCRLARWRTTDPGEMARAMQVEKPAVQVDDQLSMFEL